jgi:glutamate decarboxylase
MMENINKNLADNDEYPALLQLQQRCVSMIGNIWGAKGSKAVGTACTGSSEAILLGGLALKRRWVEKRKAAGTTVEVLAKVPGKDTSNPNILMAANAQVALEFSLPFRG